jgi:hypothetical protein
VLVRNGHDVDDDDDDETRAPTIWAPSPLSGEAGDASAGRVRDRQTVEDRRHLVPGILHKSLAAQRYSSRRSQRSE